MVGADWGQDQRRLGVWQAENAVPRVFYTHYAGHPEGWGVRFEAPPCTATEGVYALHAVEVHRPRFIAEGCLAWLTAEPPDDRLGYSIYLYTVDAAAAARLAARADRRPFWTR